jgi:arsenate reductase (thioredoxin)
MILAAGGGDALDAALTTRRYASGMQRQRVIFVCTHNSARSQMAEAMLNRWGGDRFEAVSAGTEATEVRPETIRVMEEIGIGLAGHRSKTIDEFVGQRFDRFVTVCDQARQACPVLPGAGSVDHWSIEDPSAVAGPPEARLAAFRRARDEIAERIRAMASEEAAGVS